MFLHICDGKSFFFLSFSHSLLLYPSSDFLSCFSSVCAMLFTVILHWPPVTRPPPSPSTPLITVLWGSAVVETWSPCASRVGITEPKKQLLITRSPKVKRRGEAKCRARSSILKFFLFCSLFLFFVLNIVFWGVIEQPKRSFIFMTGHQLQPEELRWRAFL